MIPSRGSMTESSSRIMVTLEPPKLNSVGCSQNMFNYAGIIKLII